MREREKERGERRERVVCVCWLRYPSVPIEVSALDQ